MLVLSRHVMYDITAETVSVWHLGRSWAGS